MACVFLSQLDLKRLRLASWQLAEKVELRIDRVFISPNRANLRCLEAILDHPRYRLQVEEILYDVSQLEEFPTLKSFEDAILLQEAAARRKVHVLLEDSLFDDDRDENPQDPDSRMLDHDDLFSDGQLTDTAKTLLLRLDNQVARDIIAKNAATMSVEDSYNLYQKLYQDEQEIMKRTLDVMTLHRALAELPNLKRITLSSHVWNTGNTAPSYDTPFLRALPPGFRKPWVWPWLAYRPEAHHVWKNHADKTMKKSIKKRLQFEWRAYSVMMSSLLAVPHPGIEAIIVDAEDGGGAGINHQLFAAPNTEYETTVEACQALRLKTFKLAINSYGAASEGNQYLSSGLLKNLFSAMQHLEHLEFDSRSVMSDVQLRGMLRPTEVFSEATLRRLRRLTLRHMHILKRDIFGLFEKLENTELVELESVVWDPSFWAMVIDLQEHVSTATCRPRFTWTGYCRIAMRPDITGRFLLDDDLNNFLYNDGECPIRGKPIYFMRSGFGWFSDHRDPTKWVKYDRKKACGTEHPLPPLHE
jgi:hypothetical protein